MLLFASMISGLSFFFFSPHSLSVALHSGVLVQIVFIWASGERVWASCSASGAWVFGLWSMFFWLGLVMWDLRMALCTSEWKLRGRSRVGWFVLAFAALSRTEDLRWCVSSTFAFPTSLCNTSSSHLLTGRKCFPQCNNKNATHTTVRSIPIVLRQAPVEMLQMELHREEEEEGVGARQQGSHSAPEFLVNFTQLVVWLCCADVL